MEGAEPLITAQSWGYGLDSILHTSNFQTNVPFKMRKLHFQSEQSAAGFSLEECGAHTHATQLFSLPSQMKTTCSC